MTSCVMGYDGNCQHVYINKEGNYTLPAGEHIAGGARGTSPLKPTTGQSKDGVAWINWAVHQLDDMEMNWPETDIEMFVGGRAWKHLRNTLRDRFKEIYGVDPSPHYNPGAATQALSSAKASGNDTEPLPPQPNTDSLESRLRKLFNEAFQYGEVEDGDVDTANVALNSLTHTATQLFNKYARDIIGEDEAVAAWRANPYSGTNSAGLISKLKHRNSLRQEQRAKLKEEGK